MTLEQKRALALADAQLKLNKQQATPESRIAGAFKAASEAKDTRLSDRVRPDQAYGFTDYMLSQLPFGDEAAGLGAGAGRYLAGKTGLAPDIGFGDAYTRGHAIESKLAEEYRTANPGKARGASALGTVAAGPGNATAAATLPGRMWQGAKGGAAIGGLYGAGEGSGLEERATNAATGAAGGAAVGAAAPVVAQGIGRMIGGRTPAVAPAPTTADLKNEAQVGLRAFENSGLTVSQKSFDDAATKIISTAKLKGIDPTLHPEATAAMKRIEQEVGKPHTAQELMTLREILTGASTAKTAKDRRIAGDMSRRYMDYLSNLKPADIAIGGDPTQVAAKMKESVKLWATMEKGKIIDRAISRADQSASGLEAGLRNEFRSLAKNEVKMRKFTPEEQAAIRAIGKGAPIQNTLAKIGRGANSILVAPILAAIGGTLGGPAGAGAAVTVPVAARGIATKITAGKAAQVGDLVRRGGAAAMPAAAGVTPLQQGLYNAGRFTTNEATGLGVPSLLPMQTAR